MLDLIERYSIAARSPIAVKLTRRADLNGWLDVCRITDVEDYVGLSLLLCILTMLALDKIGHMPICELAPTCLEHVEF